MGNKLKKSLSVYDAWFGFYGDFKKGTFDPPNEHGRAKWVNVNRGLKLSVIDSPPWFSSAKIK